MKPVLLVTKNHDRDAHVAIVDILPFVHRPDAVGWGSRIFFDTGRAEMAPKDSLHEGQLLPVYREGMLAVSLTRSEEGIHKLDHRTFSQPHAPNATLR